MHYLNTFKLASLVMAGSACGKALGAVPNYNYCMKNKKLGFSA
jgi:hypothetical protein